MGQEWWVLLASKARSSSEESCWPAHEWVWWFPPAEVWWFSLQTGSSLHMVDVWCFPADGGLVIFTRKCYNPKMLTTHKNYPLNIWTTQFFYPQNILKIFWPSKFWPPKELLYQQNVLIQFSFPFLLKFILSRVPILFSKPSYGNPIGWFWKIQSHNFPPKNRPNLHCICLSLHLWTTTIFNIENMWLF